jgi:hypothetical protein
MNRAQTETITIEGVGTVLLERSCRAKRISMTVKPGRRIRVAVPEGVSFRRAGDFARSRRPWLEKSIAVLRERQENSKRAAAVKEGFTREKARQILTARVEEIAIRHGFRYNRVSVRNQKTRWGSCSGRNDISLNLKLTRLPDDLRDYVILHELVHTRIKNHGPAFRLAILRIEPRADALRQKLRQYCLHSL